MLSVTEAQQIVLQQVRPLAPVVAALGPELLGLVLAEAVASDLDLPPYDKAMMDGYAVQSADLAKGAAVLQVVEEVLAGQTPQREVGTGQATRIMTGAPVPAGTDAVIMVERTRLVEADRVQIEDRPPQPGLNILPRGREMRQGETILQPGSRLRPQEIGLLAAVGKTAVQVHPAPEVAILPTGDEIVEPRQRPGPGQIRNSNGPMLAAQVQRAGGRPHALGIARDTEESLRQLIQRGLRADVLILSGGVSAGKKDLVPGVLAELGVQPYFHKVAMKPGKPVYFGWQIGDGRWQMAKEQQPSGANLPSAISNLKSTLVFGLPGNPVSSLVCFELFVRPALRRLQNQVPPLPPLWPLPLAADFSYRTDRPTYHPARLQWKEGHPQVQMIPWFGSPDLRGLTEANCFAVIPPGDHTFRAGQTLEVLAVEYP
jgi:molybdopterin molybdotransferase